MKTVGKCSTLLCLLFALLHCSVLLAGGNNSAGSDRSPAPEAVDPTAKVDEDNCLLDLTVRRGVVVGSSANEIRVGQDCESGEMYNAIGFSIAVILPVNDHTMNVQVRAVDKVGIAVICSN